MSRYDDFPDGLGLTTAHDEPEAGSAWPGWKADKDVFKTGASGGTYVDALQFYADKGKDPGLIDAVKKIKSTADKALMVGADATLGAGVGAAIPVLGELGIGEAAGALVGAIYGAFDQFGGDIMAVINPPSFSDGDYDRMRRAGIQSGGIPNPGHAPDNYGGVIYPDDSLSGGDDPFPGMWNGKIMDQAAYNRAVATGRVYVPHAPGFWCRAPVTGIIVPCNIAEYLKANTPKVSKPVIQVRKGMHPLTVKLNTAAIARVKQVISVAPKALPKATITVKPSIMKTALQTVHAAAMGDEGAKQDIADTVSAARAGDPQAINDARILTAAQRDLLARSFVAHYLALAGRTVSAGPIIVGAGCGCGKGGEEMV